METLKFRRNALALSALLACAGCKTSECAPGTVFVTLSLSGGAERADSLDVALGVDGAEAQHQRVARRSQSNSDSLTLSFAAGYPSGQLLRLVVVAYAGDAQLASAVDDFSARPDCDVRSLRLVGSTTGGSDGGDGGDGGGGDDGGDGGCVNPGGSAGAVQLTALHPSVANTGQTLTLEGTFVAGATVNFPGGVTQAATVLGPHRATVVVPAGATQGDLTVTTDGQMVGPRPFRRASFALGLGQFNAAYEQAEGARQMPRLSTGRQAHAGVVAGGSVYVIGGSDGASRLSSVERATLNADGSLSRFSTLAASLVTARDDHTSVVLGSSLYVLGGAQASGPLADVERATINGDGTLSPFARVAGTSFAGARSGHTSVVVGKFLYVIGGSNGVSPLQSVERATINPDGSLSSFATPCGVTLTTARRHATSVAVGGYLYVLGGEGQAGDLQSVERATINPDGSLSTFAPATGVSLAAARAGHSAHVLGNSLYVVGGQSAGSSVERSTIGAGGSLSAFATVSGIGPATPRRVHLGFVAGNALYLVGGSGALASVERASVDADGTFGDFATVSGVTLTNSRHAHASVVLGNWLYVIGGSKQGGNTTLAGVERAVINPDGSIQNFAAAPGVTLATGRGYHKSAVVGNWLYVFGGLGGATTLTSVERAAINPDGSLSTFATVAGVTLASARLGFSCVVSGNFLYVFGGYTTAGATTLASVERAAINPDGSIQTFAAAPGVTLGTARRYSTSFAVGNSVYVIAGSAQSSVELATAGADGTLSDFSVVAGVALQTGRNGPASVALGGSLYVVGGDSTAPLASVERAPISPAGSLATFTTVAGVTLQTARTQPTLTVLGNLIYVIGGAPGNASDYDSLERVTLP